MSRFVHSEAHCNFNDYCASFLTLGIAEMRKYAFFIFSVKCLNFKFVVGAVSVLSTYCVNSVTTRLI